MSLSSLNAGCGALGVTRKKKATLVSRRKCILSAALKLHLDLPQRFLTNNFAADYQSDFQQGLHVTFTLSGQLCGPEVNLPVKKGVNRRNDQNGNISWKHKLCIGKDVRLSLPQLAWVGSIEATGPRHITVDLHTQPPQVQQQRQAQQRAQQLAGAVSKPIAGASATAHSARRQAAGKLQAAARHRVSITAVNRKTPQPNNLVLIEPAAKRQCTEARKAPTAAGFAAARSRLIASGQPAAMGKAPNAVASGNNSLSQHLPSAAAAAARSGAGAPGSALRHSSSSSNSSSGWHPMDQRIERTTSVLPVHTRLAQLLQSQQQQHQQQASILHVQLLIRTQQATAGVAAKASMRSPATAAAVLPAAAEPSTEQQQAAASWRSRPSVPCQLRKQHQHQQQSGSPGASRYQVAGKQLQEQLQQYGGWYAVAVRMVGPRKLQYQLQLRPASYIQQHQQWQQQLPSKAGLVDGHEQLQRPRPIAAAPAVGARKQLLTAVRRRAGVPQAQQRGASKPHSQQQKPAAASGLAVRRQQQQQQQQLSDVSVATATAGAAVNGHSSPTSSSSSDDQQPYSDSTSDEDFVPSDEYDRMPDNYKPHLLEADDVEDLQTHSRRLFGSSVLQQHRQRRPRQSLLGMELLGKQQRQRPHQFIAQPAGVGHQHNHQQQQQQQQPRHTSANDAGCGAAPAAGTTPKKQQKQRQQPAATGSTGTPAASAGLSGSGAAAAAAATGPGAGGGGDTGDERGDGNEDGQEPAAAGDAAGVGATSAVISYFMPLNQRVKLSSSKVKVRIPKRLVDLCLPQLAAVKVGEWGSINVMLLLLEGNTQADAKLNEHSDGVVSMGDTQCATVRVTSKAPNRQDNQDQLLYTAEDIGSSHNGELWAAGVATYDAGQGIKVMVTPQNPGNKVQKSKIMALNADGTVLPVVERQSGGQKVVPAAADGNAAAAAAAAASVPARTPLLAPMPVSRRPSHPTGDSASLFLMRQHLDPPRPIILPRLFIAKHMPELCAMEKGDSLPLAVTMAVLPAGTTAVGPHSQVVETHQLGLQVSLPADNKDGRYFITGTHALSSCHIVTSGQYYIAGVIKLGETAIKFFVSDTRPPYKHPGRSSAAGIAASEQSNMAAGDADAHVASADLAAAAEDDESADVPDLDAAELAVDDAEAEEAAEAAAAAEAEAGQAAGAAAAAAAGPIEEQLQLPGPLYQVTQTIFGLGNSRAPRLPNSFLVDHMPVVRQKAGPDFPTGCPLVVQLVLLPPAAADVSPDNQPEAVILLKDTKAVTWQHPTKEAGNKTEIRPVMKHLEGFKSQAGELFLVGLKTLGRQAVQLLLSQQLHPDARPHRPNPSHYSPEELQKRRRIAAAVGSPTLEPGQQRKPLAGKLLGRSGSGIGTSGQLLQQQLEREASLGRSGSGISAAGWQQQRRQSVEGQKRQLQEGALAHKGSGNVSVGDSSKRSRQQQHSGLKPPTAAAAAAAAGRVGSQAQTICQQQQQRQQQGLRAGLPDVAARLAALEVEAAGDVAMQDAVEVQQQQRQGLHSPADPPVCLKIPIRYYAAARFQGIKIPLADWWAAVPEMDHMLNGEMHRLLVQFMVEDAVVAGPLQCQLTAFKGDYLRLYDRVLNGVIQHYDGYSITSISAAAEAEAEAQEDGDNAQVVVLSLHIAPPEPADEFDLQPHPIAAAVEQEVQQLEAEQPPLPMETDQQQQQQQQQSKQQSHYTQQHSINTHQHQQQQQQQHSVPGNQPQGVPLQQQECESKPLLVPVKQELDQHPVFHHHHQQQQQQAFPLPQQQEGEEIPSPFLAAAAAAAAAAGAAAVPPQAQQQQQKQNSAPQMPSGPPPSSTAAAAAAAAAGGGGAGAGAGSLSDPMLSGSAGTSAAAAACCN